MKKILFTSVTFKNYAGSELVTLSEAQYFANNDYQVDIFTLEYDNPLISIIKDEKNIRVYNLDEVDQLEKKYDLLISRQYPMLDYLLFTIKTKAKRVYYQSVSYRIPIDAFPLYYRDITMTGVASLRIKEELQKKGFDTSASYYFPNYATKEYFEYEYEKPTTLKKIVIVSNHIPSELEDFANYAKEAGYHVDLVGMHHNYKLVTPALLSEYDLVISIGKTTFYSIAMGLPSYTYDEVVSLGYVTSDNYQKCLNNNMAYAKEYKAKTGQEIYLDVINNYEATRKQSAELKARARKDFLFDDLMSDFLAKLEAMPPMDYEKLYQNYPTLEYTARTYVEEMFFAKKEIMKWYLESIKLGNLYQAEIEKTIKNIMSYESTYKKYNEVTTTKGWLFLEKIRKLRSKFRK